MANVKVTALNSMLDKDFEQALDRHVSWGIQVLDLKDGIFGKGIVALTEEEAKRAAGLISQRDLSVHCLSTVLFSRDIELGEERFRKDCLEKIDHVIQLARILRPQVVRFIAAQTSKRKEIENSVEYISSNHPWLLAFYGEAADKIYDAGFRTAIENESGNCIFKNPEEIVDFFGKLGRREKIYLIWDVGNLWQMGIYPTMDVYNKLKGLIGYYHLKGGRPSEPEGELGWKTSLEDATWPLVEITKQVVADGVSPVICLNGCSGKRIEGYDYSNMTKRNVDYVRRAIPGVE
ncbi:sugar phosphate isomerase/epimerase family protein [Candidatus Poribacteria bacterium]